MKKSIVLLVVCFLIFCQIVQAQETRFGKNKVRYKNFDWSYIQTRHFDIYFYENGYETAKFAASVLESAYDEIAGELSYLIQKRIPVFAYNSQNDFQQTNITTSILPEGVGGFTEMFKNRVVNPFFGSYEDFRHVLHHELTHAITFDMLYGGSVSSLMSRQRLFSMPLWLAEGFAEYSSRHGWDVEADMFVRDATINGYLAPPEMLGGFLAYKQGQAMIKYIADTYGEEKIGEVFRQGKIHLTMNKAIKNALGISQEEFWKDFSKAMKRRYWPEIALRKEAEEIGKPLTKAREDGSYFNEKPVFTPDGDKIAIFTDRSDYTEIVLISAEDGRQIKRLVKAGRSGDLESLHAYVSGVSFSPDGSRMVFVAKSKGQDVLKILDVDRGKQIKTPRHDFYNIINPAWSPDGKMIAFSALKNNKRDLWIFHIESEQAEQITDDRYDDVEPSWLMNSEGLVFSSDRPHPQNPSLDTLENIYVGDAARRPGDFEYGYYNLFRIQLSDRSVLSVDVGPGQNRAPAVSPIGDKVAFISKRNGISNIYVAYLDSTKYFAITDILTGVRSLSWSPDGQKLTFSAFNKGAFDIFVMEDIVPVGDRGVLKPTDFILGKYDLLKPNETHLSLTEEDASNAEPEDGIKASSDDEYVIYPLDREELAALVDSLNADSSGAEVDTIDVATVDTEDSVITESGMYDGEWVQINKPYNALDSLMLDIPDENDTLDYAPMAEPPLFDSIPLPLPGGEYEIRPYKVKFTPDYAGGGFAYDTYFGLRGQTVVVFSDYLGNHQIMVATDLVNTIDQSDLQAYYFYNRMRTNLGVGFFHTKNFYLMPSSDRDSLFSDRFYGFHMMASRPFSLFSRLELTASQFFIDREHYDREVDRKRNSKVSTGEFAWVTDNILWGQTGPINGRRIRFSVNGGKNLFDGADIDFYAAELDLRKYWHIKGSFSFAFRVAAGASFGSTPKQYFLGGTTNWIGNRVVDAEVYNIENLYFAGVVTPLRGVEYYELTGTRYGLVNLEFRYPMIRYLALGFPLPLVISNVTGSLFSDFGAAWDENEFKGGTTSGGQSRLQDIKSGFGWGMRANLGFLLLRYDMAWATDYNKVAEKPRYYFSFGADF